MDRVLGFRRLVRRVVDVLKSETTKAGKTIPQSASTLLLTGPAVTSVYVGARDEALLQENFSATGWAAGFRNS